MAKHLTGTNPTNSIPANGGLGVKPTVNRYRKPAIPIIIPERVAERAATKYVEDEEGCWISTYSTASHGYAQIGWQNGGYKQVVTAHRASWVYHTGEQIPEGMTIDHTCKNRPCINPDHLRMTTNFENARRTFGRDWKLGECANGHPNSELYWDGSRYRCGPCTRATQARYRQRHSARVAASKERYAKKKLHPSS